jgi:hypothetical protein
MDTPIDVVQIQDCHAVIVAGTTTARGTSDAKSALPAHEHCARTSSAADIAFQG